MVSSFVREIEGITFTFNSMNAERLQLYQVYVLDNEVKKRFHMQLNEENRFKIMDHAACPVFCFPLEDVLHDAILENHACTL
ncbi:MAG: hypothetical protein EOO61_06500 [Hymenobacter sp.]|nr:MAG: hypothetical protein EOO61_06500 [Hymenobacter sp.]